MFKFRLLLLFVCWFCFVVTVSKVSRFQPVLERIVESMMADRSEIDYPGCKWLRSSGRQTKMCKNDPGLLDVLFKAKQQAISACEETFMYDRWNCSLHFNNKLKRGIFKQIYRETAFMYALTTASLTHAIAKGCSSGNLRKCPCHGKGSKDAKSKWKRNGCGDDLKYGKRATRNFIDLKNAGNDEIAEILKHDVKIGMEAMNRQLREVCKCHGFSGSCTTKTCWKRIGPFTSVMGLLKKHYHHAIKKKIVNYTTKRAIGAKERKRLKNSKGNLLLYLQKTPNLCAGTSGRECRNGDNCATLCCGRGSITMKKVVESQCKCRMIKCCVVKCDTCKENVDYHVCK